MAKKIKLKWPFSQKFVPQCHVKRVSSNVFFQFEVTNLGDFNLFFYSASFSIMPSVKWQHQPTLPYFTVHLYSGSAVLQTFVQPLKLLLCRYRTTLFCSKLKQFIFRVVFDRLQSMVLYVNKNWSLDLYPSVQNGYNQFILKHIFRALV